MMMQFAYIPWEPKQTDLMCMEKYFEKKYSDEKFIYFFTLDNIIETEKGYIAPSLDLLKDTIYVIGHGAKGNEYIYPTNNTKDPDLRLEYRKIVDHLKQFGYLNRDIKIKFFCCYSAEDGNGNPGKESFAGWAAGEILKNKNPKANIEIYGYRGKLLTELKRFKHDNELHKVSTYSGSFGEYYDYHKASKNRYKFFLENGQIKHKME